MVILSRTAAKDPDAAEVTGTACKSPTRVVAEAPENVFAPQMPSGFLSRIAGSE